MHVARNEERVTIQPRIRRSVKTWLETEARKQERSTSWMVDRLLADAMEASQRQEVRA